LVAVGDGALRREIFNRIQKNDKKIISFISTKAQVGNDYEPDLGIQIFSGCFVSGNVKLGRGVIINVNCSLSHDCMVGDFSTLSPACILGGRVRIENQVLVGLGAKIANRKLNQPLIVGANSIVGAGSMVIEDVESNQVVAGVPALSIRSL